MTGVDAQTTRQLGSQLPDAIRRLECSLTSAFGADEMVTGLPLEHRIRIYDDLEGMIADAASAAARDGHAAWALRVVELATERRPRWSQGYAEQYWIRLIDTARDAVLESVAD